MQRWASCPGCGFVISRSSGNHSDIITSFFSESFGCRHLSIKLIAKQTKHVKYYLTEELKLKKYLKLIPT
jgi:hypothetical protein